MRQGGVRGLLLFLFSHRLLAIARWDFHFLAVRLGNYLTFQDWRIARTVAKRPRPLYLNLGSGFRGLDDPHWINIDGFRDKGVHFLVDFGRRLPFADETFDGVFCEHVLEHFTLEEGSSTASEVLRVLAPGGCFRIVVPDAELVLKRYFDEPAALVQWRGASPDQSPMEIVNSYFRQRYEHQFLYDYETMRAMLVRAGFREVSRSEPGAGASCPAIVLDDSKYKWESLYVEAVK